MTTFHTYGELAAQRPTGKTRWRHRFLFRPVLQVEIISPLPRYPSAPPPPGAPYDPWARGSYTFWRDATPADKIRVKVKDLNQVEEMAA